MSATIPKSSAATRKKVVRRVLLTGFDPFGGEAINPSWEAVRALDGERIGRHRIVARQLPTEFARAPNVLAAAIDEVRPVLVLCVGQAGGRAQVSVERVALNLADARIADNAGAQPVDSALIANAPHAYFAALPVKRVVERLNAAGIPAEVSHHAGNFVCNAVLFALCHRIAHHDPDLRGGFIHVPYLPEQARNHPNVPSMSLATMIEALRVSIAAALE